MHLKNPMCANRATARLATRTTPTCSLPAPSRAPMGSATRRATTSARTRRWAAPTSRKRSAIFPSHAQTSTLFPTFGHILQGACKPDSKYFSGTVDDCPFSCTDGSCKRGGSAKCQDKSYGCSVYKQQVDYEQFNIIQRSIKIKNFYNLDSLFELISPQCWIKHDQITNIFWITPCVI